MHFLVGCTDSLPFRSALVREVEDTKRRTTPNDGSLTAITEPLKNNVGIRATWEVSTGFDSKYYIHWLKYLFPEYRMASETGSKLTLAKQVEPDSYSLEINVKTPSLETVAEVTFAVGAD